MLAIGFGFSRRQTSTEEYFLAGRRMPWLVVALSMFASLTSAVTYMGVPGTVYTEVHWIWYFLISFTVATSVGFLFSLLLGGEKAARELTLWGRSQLGQLE